MKDIEKRIQMNDNRVLIYRISEGYAKPTYTIMEGFLDNGDVIKREFVFPTIKNEEFRTFHRRLEIDMDTGFSNDENLFLQYSEDGGYTWSNVYWVNLVEKAEYNRKLEWRRL